MQYYKYRAIPESGDMGVSPGARALEVGTEVHSMGFYSVLSHCQTLLELEPFALHALLLSIVTLELNNI